MSDKLSQYKEAEGCYPNRYWLWPLYGAGFDSMGVNGKPIEVGSQQCAPDELVVRHDAVGLCFSDIKIINLGQNHPRIHHNMQATPVILGHEVAMTVLAVGKNLRERYKPGDRLTIEADIYVDGVSLAYGYTFQGGLSQYAVIDRLVMNNDHGDALIPVDPSSGYAESALTEPWACVIAAYRLEYRTSIRSDGSLWIIGGGDERPYTISAGFNVTSHPARLLLTDVPAGFDAWLRKEALALNIEVLDVPDVSSPPLESVDDIILLGANPDLVEKASPFLAPFGIFSIAAEKPMSRKVAVDVGRVHYSRWVYVGTTSTDLAAAYRQVPVRSKLKPGGKVWFVGAGGPIGRMHVQAAISFENRPATIVCSDVSNTRLDDLCLSFASEAQQRGIEWVCLNPNDKEHYAAVMSKYIEEGFDDIVVLVPVPAVISDAAAYAAEKGVINVFAGINKGTSVDLDLSDVYQKQVRMIGHSGSNMIDMHITLEKARTSELSRNRSVAAIGSLSAARDGLMAVKDTVYPGKVIIYPNIKELPLTAITDLKDYLPAVYAKLKEGREWTNEAEEELFRQMLP
ncbi:MAG TPA: alcohol dehydrogenase catalytic domain-containing protein [Levilinea sp.]|nr:alcohol dehydrogenase catalytic domain-containing protein [Levilinea sp.]